MAEIAGDCLMARKPPVDYGSLTLEEPEATPAEEGRGGAQPAASTGHKPRTLKEAASAVVLYIHPAAHKQIKQWCLDEGIRVHDFLIDAVEESMRSKGLRAVVRAEVAKSKRAFE